VSRLRHTVDAATRIRHVTPSVVRWVGVGVGSEGGHSECFYSSESPWHVKPCTTVVISCYNKEFWKELIA
jgi:hypothetical protein